MNDGLDDHPDLADLGWSKREERRALRRVRPPRPRPGAAFLRRHRVKVISVGGVLALLVAGVVLISGIDRSATADKGIDLDQPFQDTPAAEWSEGAAGIVAPDPVAIGDYTAEEVAAAYAAVRQLLITARLDRTVIVEHNVEPYVRQLAPMALIPETGLVTRISDDFRLLPVEPRVRGRMAAELGQHGALVVRTDYVVAYAFDAAEPDRLVGPMDLVAVERVATDVTVHDERWPVTERGLWPIPVAGYAYSAACTAYKKDGLLAPSYSERVVTDRAAGDGKAILDPNQPMPTASNCPD